MEQKIIFLDIDGTLTEPGKNIVPKSALWAIAQARKQGHYVFLCTGRSYGMILPLLKYDFDGVIASAGGYIECRKEVIYDCPMTEEQRRTAMALFKGNGIFYTLECMDGCYTDDGFKDFLRSHAGEGNNSELLRWQEQIEKSLNVFPMEKYRGQPVYKIIMVGTSWEQFVQPKKILSSDFVFSIPGEDQYGFINGEIINRKFNKGKAVRQVCERLNIPLCRSIAIGDSINDIEMLETAGISICMRNGSEELKKVADDICPSVQEDGILYVFSKYCLTGKQ